MEEKVQGIRSIIGRYKIDGERLRMLQETQKSKKLYVQPMNTNEVGGMLEGWEVQGGGGRKRNWENYIIA